MPKLLLVDENSLRGSLRKSILERSFGEVVRASDAAEALCLVESPEFADSLRMVITGSNLSGISGVEFVSELRARMPSVPVVVLSASAEAEVEYSRMDGVFHSRAQSPEEVRLVVSQLLLGAQKQTA